MPIPGGQQSIVDDAPGEGRTPYAPREGTSAWHGTSEPPAVLGRRGDTYFRRATEGQPKFQVWDKTPNGWTLVQELVDADEFASLEGSVVNVSEVETTAAAAGDVMQRLASGGYGLRRGLIIAKPEEADIQACLLRASLRGDADVFVPAGYDENGDWQMIPLTEPLPAYSGVRIRGVVPRSLPRTRGTGVHAGYFGEFEFVGGTVFEGDGTFRGYQHNATDLVAEDEDISTSALYQAHLECLGFHNFSDGIKIGAKNNLGPDRCHFDHLYFTQCGCTVGSPGWAMDIQNPILTTFGTIRVDSEDVLNGDQAGHGIRMGHTLSGPPNTGNIHWENICVFIGAVEGRRTIGLEVFAQNLTDATSVTFSANFGRTQVQTSGNRTKLSVTANLTSGSSTIGVPDASLFEAGYLVKPTTAVGGLSTRMYYVRAVDTGANTITIGDRYGGSAFSATGTTSVTLETYGYPHVRIMGKDNGLVSPVNAHDLDIEGAASVALYLESCSRSHFASGAPASAGSLCAVVARNSVGCLVRFNYGDYDIDATSATTMTVLGNVGAWMQYAPPGIFQGADRGRGGMNVGARPTPLAIAPDIVDRNGFISSGQGFGERIFGSDSASRALSAGSNGVNIFTGTSGDATWTLPTITDNLTSDSSNKEMWIEVHNISDTAKVTLNTDGAQLFNRGGGTSVVIPAGTALRVTAGKLANGTLAWRAIWVPVHTAWITIGTNGSSFGAGISIASIGSYESLRYKIEPERVALRGVCKGASGGSAANDTLFTLPTGGRPASDRRITMLRASGAVATATVAAPTGVVTTDVALSASEIVSFDGISVPI